MENKELNRGCVTCWIAHAQLKPRIGPILYFFCVGSNLSFFFISHVLFRRTQFLLFSAYVQCIFSDLKICQRILDFILNIISTLDLIFLHSFFILEAVEQPAPYKVNWDKHCMCGTTIINSRRLCPSGKFEFNIRAAFSPVFGLCGGLVVSLTA